MVVNGLRYFDASKLQLRLFLLEYIKFSLAGNATNAVDAAQYDRNGQPTCDGTKSG